ncbi:diguanylate cyclase [Roseibium denhamense]|uniref:PAS domain S-box-containing protein/diguanylate cyclase (GGDEF) domain-containing protein n=1 Tax=Roseibium denhamense TaxID=76305 RepID=A0ABY1PJT3_9HYPH|nr:PAS-domain containing protein [Roseibium denhamense]MTI05925.1 diguanylate cyclase [Roseibium denhamense]SMP35836.1 PAS domain S-box-containing protein/diguanylate cyclase (GGDEF) domain-containing protein [Roseibium denhamense]
MTLALPQNELERLEALRELALLGSDRLPEYDAVVDAIAAIFDCPIALISLVDAEEQWFKARVGLDIDCTPRSVSFCQHALESDDILIVQDARLDERFKDNPLVTGEPHIRFYAGYPLSLDGRNRIGTLCVIDRKPRLPRPEQLQQLRRMGSVVEGLFKTHKANLTAAEARRHAEREHEIAERESILLEEITAVSGVGGWEMCLRTNEVTWTRKTREIHEVPADYVPTIDAAISFYPPASRKQITDAISKATRTGGRWDLELPFRTAKGRDIWVRAVGRPIMDGDTPIRLVGALEDITDRKRQEQELRKSEVIHRTTLESLEEGVLLLSPTGLIQSCNPSAAQMMGYRADQIIGRPVSGLGLQVQCDGATGGCDPFLLAARDPAAVSNLVASIVPNGRPHSMWLRLNARAIVNAGPNSLAAVVVSMADITETKKQADTLQVVFENLPGGLVYYDADERLATCNMAFKEMLDLPQELIDGNASLEDVARFMAERGDYGDGDLQELLKNRLAVIRSKDTAIYERSAPDGRVLEVRGTSLESGGHIASFYDVTERKAAEAAVHQSELINRTTLEALSEGVVLLDRDGIIKSCNPAATDLLGFNAEEIIGRRLQDLGMEASCTIHGKPCDPFHLAAADPDAATDMLVCVVPNGRSTRSWLRLNATAVDHTGDSVQETVVLSITDITETKNQADQLNVIFDNVPGGFAHFDETRQLTRSNREVARILDYPDELMDQKLHLLDYMKFNAERGDYGTGDPETLALERLNAFPPDQPHRFERSSADGKYIDFRSTPLPNGGFIYNCFDITERKTLEKQLAENERQARQRNEELEAILANMRQGVSVFDQSGRLRVWNQQYLDIFNKPDSEVQVGKTLVELISAEKDRGEFEGDVQEHVMDLMIRLSAGEVVRSKFGHPSGKVISAVHAPMPGGGWIGTHEDITLREQAQAKITYAAHHDSLTGLANRTLFNAKLDDALIATQIQGTFSDLMLLDLDKFKPVNDTFGHDVGDELLKQVAQRLKDCVRASDLVARLGGDEFAIILGGTGVESAGTAEIAERIVFKLNSPFVIFGHTISIGASIGISQINDAEPDSSSVIKKADIALYDVKHGGRNGYRFHREIEERWRAKNTA